MSVDPLEGILWLKGTRGLVRPAGGWIQLLRADRLKQGFQKGVCQTQCFISEWVSPNDCCQILSPGQVPFASYLFRRHSRISKWIQPRVLSNCFLCTGARSTWHFVCIFKNGVSWSPEALPNISPTNFQSQLFWGIIFWVHFHQAEEPEVGLGPFAPWGIGPVAHSLRLCYYSCLWFADWGL